MSVCLDNEYSYAAELIAQAVTLPDGAFIEVDDLAFGANGMGRKIAQTQQVTIDGRTVSMAHVEDDPGIFDLVLRRDRPKLLGTYAELRQRHAEMHDRLAQAFGGPTQVSVHAMVMALVGLTSRGLTDERDAAAWARLHGRRSAWLVQHRMEAIAEAPVCWAELGLGDSE
jgi:hypothetical protein